MSQERNPYEGVIDVQGAVPEASDRPSTLLAKTPSLELRRLRLAAGQEIPTHHARGEITVHCLEGRIRFTAAGAARELGAGQLLVLNAGEPHSVVGVEASTVLVTKLPGPPGASA